MFSQPLTDDEKSDQIRFTFPRSYGQRYGTAPTNTLANAPSQAGLSQDFTLECQIQQSGPIKSISCPSSHPIELSIGKPDSAYVDEAVPDSHLAMVRLTSQPLLSQDFILVITATGLDRPRCFAESHRSSDRDTIAMSMSFVPRFTLPDVQEGMEYIFVVDRSGSMDEVVGSKGTSRIGLVRQALIILLKGLPSKSTRFNIISFGSRCDSLWPKSAEYNQAKLDQAVKHVNKMQANYGGTETGRALKHAFDSLAKDRKQPTSIFLLTDGDAWMVAETVQQAKAALDPSAPFVRVFSIGIGSGISTDTCDSVARAGEGFAIYIQDGEPMTGKCARLVRASRSPPVNNVRIKWAPELVSEQGDDFEIITGVEDGTSNPNAEASQTSSVNLFDDTTPITSKEVGPPGKPIVTLGEPPAIRSAPLNTSFIFPGTRVNFFALFSNRIMKEHGIPKSVNVSGTVLTTGSTVELEVPVTLYCSPKHFVDNPPLIHSLAAHALITDLEDGKIDPPRGIAEQIWSDSMYREAYLEAEIVRLGTTYGLTSRHTSYIAIDENENVIKAGQPWAHDAMDSLSEEECPEYDTSWRGAGGTGATTRLMSTMRVSKASPGSMLFRGRCGAAPPAPVFAPAPACARPPGAFAPPSPPPPPSGAPSYSVSFGSSGATLADESLPPVGAPAPTRTASYNSDASHLPPQSSHQSTRLSRKRESVVVMDTEKCSTTALPKPSPFRSVQGIFGKLKKQTQGGESVKATGMVTVCGQTAPHEATQDTESLPQRLCDQDDDVDGQLLQVAHLQDFDGHFNMSSSLLDLLFIHSSGGVEGALKRLNKVKQQWIKEDEQVLATLLAIAWMQAHVKDASLDLVEKAMEWVMSRLDTLNTTSVRPEQVQEWIQSVMMDQWS